MEFLEGKVQGISIPDIISTRLQKAEELALQAPGMVFTTLAHHSDVVLLKEAFHLTSVGPGRPWIGSMGQVSVKTEPPLAVILHAARPPCARAMAATTANPRPLPPERAPCARRNAVNK